MSEQHLRYIRNPGGNPPIEWFDSDWEPIGPKVRQAMKDAGLIYEENGKIFLIKEQT